MGDNNKGASGGAAPAPLWIVLGLVLAFGAAIAARFLFVPLQPPTLSCPLDVKFEQLHIVVTRVDDRLELQCMYLGSRGTYRARKP
jgi:hypothetical protein